MRLRNLLEGFSPFTQTTTHMSDYDDMLHDPEYFKEKKNKVFTIVHMSPREYIQQAYDSFKEHGHLQPHDDLQTLVQSRSDTLITKYQEKMKKGEKFPMLVLDFCSRPSFSGGREKSFSQDGIHRAIAAHRAGVTEVPVMVVDDAK